MEGFIALHRKMLDWEWYTDANVKAVFLHCLLKANYETRNWRGISIERGEFLTSVAMISSELELTPMQVRTALNKLLSTGEITIRTTNKYSIVTISNYDSYQDFECAQQQAKEQATKQSNNKRITNKEQQQNNNNNNNNNNKNTTPKGDSVKSPAFDFKGVLISQYGVPETIADTWLEVRRKRRAVNSELALNAIVREATKASISVAEAVRLAAENSWQSFQASYIKPQYKPQGESSDNMLDLAAEVQRLKAIREGKQNNNLQQQ